MVKFYKIPDWHELYALYENYLKNRAKTKILVIKFMKKHGLNCSYVKVGYDIRQGMKKGEQILEDTPFFKFKDNDPKVEESDKRKLYKLNSKLKNDNLTRCGVPYTIKDNEGFYGLRKNTPFMKVWEMLLVKNDNFQMIEVPDVLPYIIFNGRGRVQKLFEKHNEDLYLCLISSRDFIVSKDLIEITEKKASEYFDMKVLKGD